MHNLLISFYRKAKYDATGTWAELILRFTAVKIAGLTTVGFLLLISPVCIGECHAETFQLSAQQWEERVLPTIQPGAVFNDSMLPKQGVIESWYKVPDWMAGTWAHDYSDQFMAGKNGPPTHARLKDHNAQTFGHLQDRSGSWWETLRVPFVNKSEVANEIMVRTVMRSTAIPRSADEFELITESIDVYYNRSTAVIISVDRRRDATVFVPRKAGGVHSLQSVQSQIFGRGSIVTNWYGIAPPTVIPQWTDGSDLRPSFARFLQSHEMAELIP